MATCSVCNTSVLTTDVEQQQLACTACAKTLGIIPMPPLSRPARPCMRCNGLQFVRVIPREHSSARLGEHNRQISGPMYATHRPTVADVGIFSVSIQAKSVPVEEPGFGLLELFACRACGFVEWYCPTAASIPGHPALMTELVDYGSDKPYR